MMRRIEGPGSLGQNSTVISPHTAREGEEALLAREGEVPAQLQLALRMRTRRLEDNACPSGGLKRAMVSNHPSFLPGAGGVHSLITGRLRYPRTEHQTGSGEDGSSGGSRTGMLHRNLGRELRGLGAKDGRQNVKVVKLSIGQVH